MISARTVRASRRPMARLTTIRGARGRRTASISRSRLRTAARKASCAMSSAAAALDDEVRGTQRVIPVRAEQRLEVRHVAGLGRRVPRRVLPPATRHHGTIRRGHRDGPCQRYVRPGPSGRGPRRDAARIEDMDRRRFLAGAAAVPLGSFLAPGPPRRCENASEALSKAGGTWLTLVTADLESHVVAVEPATGRIVVASRRLPARGVSRASVRRGPSSLTRPSVASPAPCTDASRPPDRRRSPRAAYTALRPADDVAFVTDSAAHRVVAVEIPTGRIASSVAVPGPARHVTLRPDGDVLGRRSARGPSASRSSTSRAPAAPRAHDRAAVRRPRRRVRA